LEPVYSRLAMSLPPRRRTSMVGAAVCMILAACRIGLPAQVVEPSVVGIITENESIPGDDDQLVTVNGWQLRVVDPGLRRIAGSSLGVDRLLISWETDDGLYFAVSVKSTASDCYNLRPDAAYDTGDSISLVWSDQADLGVQLRKGPAFEPRLADTESKALILPIELCLDDQAVVISD